MPTHHRYTKTKKHLKGLFVLSRSFVYTKTIFFILKVIAPAAAATTTTTTTTSTTTTFDVRRSYRFFAPATVFFASKDKKCFDWKKNIWGWSWSVFVHCLKKRRLMRFQSIKAFKENGARSFFFNAIIFWNILVSSVLEPRQQLELSVGCNYEKNHLRPYNLCYNSILSIGRVSFSCQC